MAARVCIVGAGAVGSAVGVRLSAAGAAVTLVARTAHYEAMVRQGGLVVREPDGREWLATDLTIADSLDGLEPFDYVLITLKSHQIADIAHQVNAICKENGVIVTFQNGLPWWFFLKYDGALANTRLQTVDPTMACDAIDISRVIGSVCYVATAIPMPGKLDITVLDHFSAGELDGSDTPRFNALCELFAGAGLKMDATSNIRDEVIRKILVNVTFNPIGAFTSGTVGEIMDFEPTKALSLKASEEVLAIASSIGIVIPRDIAEQKLMFAARVAGGFKTSMAQDREANKLLEASLLTGLIEVAQHTGTSVPFLTAFGAMLELINRRTLAASE